MIIDVSSLEREHEYEEPCFFKTPFYKHKTRHPLVIKQRRNFGFHFPMMLDV